jgi:hypothetical protein
MNAPKLCPITSKECFANHAAAAARLPFIPRLKSYLCPWCSRYHLSPVDLQSLELQAEIRERERSNTDEQERCFQADAPEV